MSILDDSLLQEEGKTGTMQVGRLSDLDTEEVSLVDTAANKRRFLIVKRHEENPMGATATKTKSTPATPVIKNEEVEVEHPAPKVAKGMAVAVLDEVYDRVDYLRSALDAAPVAKNDEDANTNTYSREARAIQIMLKGLSGVTKSSTLLVPVRSPISGALTETYKAEAGKVLNEVARRVESMKSEFASVEILDAVQARSINATGDLLAAIPHAVTKGQALIIMSSLSADQRDVALSTIEKSMAGLADVYVALQTDVIAKGAHVADQFIVGATLHDHAAMLEKAVTEFLGGQQGEVDLIDGAIEEMRALQNVEKMFKVVPMRGKFSVVESTEGKDDKVHASFPNAQMAQGMAARMNAKKAGAKTAKMETLMKVLNLQVEETKTEKGVDDGQKAEDKVEVTEKSEAPADANRLTRLKSAVSLFKSGLGDLRSGEVPTEKFNEVGVSLGSLLTEIQVEKRGAAAALSGVEDKRTASPEAPNMGSGVQPDTDVIGDMNDVMGAGTGETATLLKNVEGMIDAKVAEVSKAKDAENAALRAELTQLRKSRSAPSTPPSDGEVVVAKGEDAPDPNSCYWPSDMAGWDGDETVDN